MKKLQIICAIAFLSFMFSCKSDDPVQPDPKETDSIELTAAEGTEITKSIAFQSPEVTLNFHTEITNKGTRDLNLYARMEIVEMSEGQASYFCWGDPSTGDGICYQPSTTDFLSDRTIEVKAGETTPPGNFIQYFVNSLSSAGNAKIRYIVYEKENEANRDTIIYNISITNN